jgi:hypothetical protein
MSKQRPTTLGDPLAANAIESFSLSFQINWCEELSFVRQGDPKIAKFRESGLQFRIRDPLQGLLEFVSFLPWVNARHSAFRAPDV